MKEKHYGAIDGLRTIASVGIVMMHARANNSYDIPGFVYNTIIPSLTNFVFLFMVISAFGMCVGYYEKILQNKISLTDFYLRRFQKILPFFGVLVILDFLLAPSVNSLYEMFADLTLMFGFLPDAGNISVIGVGWFLGLIFVFYVCFPFFCFLIENRRRAWMAFCVSVLYNVACSLYFQVGRKNILYCACFFLAGGLIYLYRVEISKWNRWIVLGSVAAAAVLYYIIGANTGTHLLVSSVLLIYAMISSGKVLQNRITNFISGISMEIYLSHMIIFRVAEKVKMNSIIGSGWFQYAFTVGVVFIGAGIFAVIVQKVINIFIKKWSIR